MKAKVYLQQNINPEYTGPVHTPDVERNVYVVMKTLNTMDVFVGKTLDRGQVQRLMDDDVAVEIV